MQSSLGFVKYHVLLHVAVLPQDASVRARINMKRSATNIANSGSAPADKGLAKASQNDFTA